MYRFIAPALFLLLLGMPGISSAASLSISPASGTYAVGDQIRLKVVVSSSDAPLNAISGTLSFPSSLFSVQSISKAGSILNFWVTEPTFSASSGIVQFEGVSLSGFQGNGGTVVTVVLRALKVGSGAVSFQSGQALANDGQGTDITSNLSGGSFQIQAAKAKPPPVVQQEEEVKQEALAVPILTTPVISLGEKDTLPAIVGSSLYTNADVLLTFVPVIGSKLFITGTTGEGGDFILSVPQALRSGPYAVSAIVVLRDGTRSNPSNILTVEVGSVFVADVSWENATYASFVLIMLFGALVAYLVWRKYFGPRRNLPTAIKREVKQAEDALHKSFTILEQDLADHLKDRGVSGRADSREREDVANLKKDLKDAENYIGKEIRDIDLIHLDEKE